MRYFVDTEFIDDGQTIDLISVGIVSNDGREYYAQSSAFYPNGANTWVIENVFPHLPLCRHVHTRGKSSVYVDVAVHSKGQCVDQHRGRIHDCPWRTRKQMMYEIAQFVQPDGEHTPFELWGWCTSYDFVALCQLYGTMMDLPLGWPHYIRDIQYILDERGISDDELPIEGTAHNALADAKHIKTIWEFLQQPAFT